MGMGDVLQTQLRKHLFRTGSFPKPTILALALFVGPPDAGGTEVATGSGYGRVNLAPLDANWTGDVEGLTRNAVEVLYGAPTGPWGTVSHLGVYDALTAGNLIVQGPLTEAKAVLAGGPAPRFAPGAITVTFD